ncbi:hypothetical protein CK203_096000 [Vitis vinifera]|uniref:Uncharacterized protein n=1 Tax=Vitis vinifera TaxID=29760 RepID=A0A438FCB7_VITVI|nr:hypothetical protein CK203_096000 [Vitis vinifera]
MVDIQNCDGTGEGGDNCLKEASPLLFKLVSHENATIADMGHHNFVGSYLNWEDISVWKEDRKGNFSVKWDYSSLCAESRVDFPTKDIWGSQAPTRLDFFTWEAP